MTEQGPAHRVLRSERGTILVIGLVGTFVATLLAIALFDLGVVQSRVQRDSVCTRRAVHAAEAGLLRAYQDIERAASGTTLHFGTLAATLTTSLTSLGPSYTDVSFRTGIPDLYSVKARLVTGTGMKTIRIVSTGRIPTGCLQEAGTSGVATVQADLSRETTPIVAPFVGRDSIKLNKDKVRVDSYNSFIGKYADSSCPKLDATGNPIKVMGCGGDLWTDGALVTKAAGNCHNSPLCLKGGASVYGSVTAARGEIWIEGKKDRASGAVWGNAAWDHTAGNYGGLYCKDQPGCVDTKDPSKSIIQGSIIQAVNGPIDLNEVTTCDTDPTDIPSAAGYTSLAWLNTKVTVLDDTSKVAPCTKGGVWCDYDENTGVLKIDENKSKGVTFQQGQYCLNTVTIRKSPGITLAYDADPTKVKPVQWNLKGNVQLDDKVKKGASPPGVESDPWLFMILSSCDRNAGCKDMQLKIGDKTDGDLGLYAYVYAPKANIKISGDNDLFGAAVGGALTVDGGLHFDHALQSIVDICPTCPIPAYLTKNPNHVLSGWKRCMAPAGGECP